jgi:hypothetical protein
MSIKRYDHFNSGMYVEDCGQYVLFTDHAAEVSRLEARVAVVEQNRDLWVQTADKRLEHLDVSVLQLKNVIQDRDTLRAQLEAARLSLLRIRDEAGTTQQAVIIADKALASNAPFLLGEAACVQEDARKVLDSLKEAPAPACKTCGGSKRIWTSENECGKWGHPCTDCNPAGEGKL